jgi:formate dehydrogenase subunit gamma
MSAAVVSRIASELKSKPGALLPILHAVQEELGYIPEDAVPILAQELNLTRAEVHGVVTFYHDFRSHPPGRHVLKICQAESCQAAGSAVLTAFAKRRLGIDFHQTTADRACSLEPVYCLGNCALSPSVMMDKEVFGRVTEERFDEILAEASQS